MNSKKTTICSLIILVIGIWALGVTVRPLSRPKAPSIVAERASSAKLISIALENYYYSNNNNLPGRLSDLFPKYIGLDKINILFGPRLALKPEYKPSAIGTNNLGELNARFAYVYTAPQNTEIIAYERPGIWLKTPRSPLKGKLYVIKRDFGIEPLSEKEIKELTTKH